MKDSIKTFIWYLSTTHAIQSPIMEIGSRQAQAQVGYADLRPYFMDSVYIGIDTEKGPGVDRVCDACERIPFEDESIPTILCLDTIEHMREPIKAMEEMRRILKPGGLLVVSSQMWFPVHYSVDYWRFTPSCFQEVLLGKFGVRQVFYQGDKNFPHTIIGVATKGEIFPFRLDMAYLNSMLPCPYPWPFELF